MSGKVYAVASGKGGVGKTTTVVNLGVTLRADDRSVALVDADLGMANLAAFLGIDHEPTLHDVLSDEASIDEALTEQADRFGILPGARDLGRYADADPGRLGAVIEELSRRYEYVLVDTGAGVGFDDVLPLELVDAVVLVASPDPAALGDARKTAEITELVDVSVRGVVLTMTADGQDADAVAHELGVELLASIPDERVVPESTASGRPLEAFAPQSGAAEGYRELAAALTGRDVERDESAGISEEQAAGEEERSGSDADEDRNETETTDEDSVAEEPLTDQADDAEERADVSETEEGDDVDEEEQGTGEVAPGDDDVEEAGAETDGPEEGESQAGDAEEAVPDEGADGAEEQTDASEASEATDDEITEDTSDDAEDDERKSGGFLSRLGGLFG